MLRPGAIFRGLDLQGRANLNLLTRDWSKPEAHIAFDDLTPKGIDIYWRHGQAAGTGGDILCSRRRWRCSIGKGIRSH
jgi:hypothetical protein